MKTYVFLKILIATSVVMLLLSGSASTPVLAHDKTAEVKLSVITGKDIRFTALTSEDGLSSGNVFGITQDAQGFLWFATGDGLSRYDGYSFRIYRFEGGNANSLSNNSMVAVCQGRKGILWMATTGGGIDRFDPATETFTHYHHETNNPNTLSGNHISKYGLYEDRQGILWIGSIDNGLNRLDPVSGNITHYRHNALNSNSLSSNSIESIYQDSSGMMWIGTLDAGLNRLDPASGRITRYLSIPNNPHTLPNMNVHGMYEDNTGTFWVSTEKGFGMLDRTTGRFTRFTIAPDRPDAASLNAIIRFYEDTAGNLWLGTGGAGILRFDRQQQRVVQYKNDPTNPHSLRNNFVSSFWADPSGTLWIGTMGGGANVFSTRQPKFVHNKHEADKPNSLADNFVLSIFEDHTGIVWIGNDRTLNRWDRLSNTWQVYRNDPANPTSISNGSVTATQEDPDGTLWFGTFFGGLNRFDPKTGKFNAYRFNSKDSHSLSDDIVRSLYIDSKGVLWVGGWNNGLNRFNRITGTFQRYQHDPNNPTSLGGGSVTDIYEDRAKTLWVATEGGGLNRFDLATEKFERFQNNPQNLKSLPDNAVRILYEDRSGQFWVGTTGGLCAFNRTTGTCTIYTVKEGLPNNTIEGILEDEQGNLWISTNNGLSRFNPKTKTFRNYDVVDGLQSNEFNNFTAFCKSRRTGEMYFGGINGFNVFNPSQVYDNPFIPSIVLTDFRLFNKSVSVGGNSVLQKTINATNELTLRYNQNSIAFEFSALCYVAPAKNKYRYKLEGFDVEWRYVSSKERLAVYTNLNPGTYIFRVKASNNDDIWNEKGTLIKIIILPPWWLTWWFKIFMIIVILSSILGFYFYRINKLNRQKRNLELIVEERTREVNEKNTKLILQAQELSEINTRLTEQQQQIKEQDEELRVNSDNLKKANDQLTENHKRISLQAEALKETNLKLIESNAAKDKFFSIIAHDLRSPFNGFLALTEIMAENISTITTAKLQVFTINLRNSATNLFRLLENLLQWARMQQGLITFNPELIHLNPIITDCIDIMQESINNKEIEITNNIYKDLLIFADNYMLQTIIRNLVSNAVKFTPKGGKISISANVVADDNSVEISVKDTGIGMDSVRIQNLFKIDIQTNRTGTEGEASSGLGLLLCKDFIEKHNGKIWVESEVGKGTTFYFKLPSKN